jgi:hypothetical protein
MGKLFRFISSSNCSPAIPAKEGIHPDCIECEHTRWIPAFAGMTGEQLRILNNPVI